MDLVHLASPTFIFKFSSPGLLWGVPSQPVQVWSVHEGCSDWTGLPFSCGLHGSLEKTQRRMIYLTQQSWLCNGNLNIVGIQLPDVSGIQMVNMFPIDKLYFNWMVTCIADKKSGYWMVIGYLWTNNSWTIRPFSYQTFCLLLRSPFGYQTKSHNHSVNGLVKVKVLLLDVSGNSMPTVMK